MIPSLAALCLTEKVPNPTSETESPLASALAKGDSVSLVGFGTFSVRHRAAREGINPQNPSQKIHIPAANVPGFKAGKALKAAVN